MFEGDIRMSSQQLVDYVRTNYQRNDRTVRVQPRTGGYHATDDKPQRGAATMTLPLWTFYKEGDDYLVPYVIDASIGKFNEYK